MSQKENSYPASALALILYDRHVPVLPHRLLPERRYPAHGVGRAGADVVERDDAPIAIKSSTSVFTIWQFAIPN